MYQSRKHYFLCSDLIAVRWESPEPHSAAAVLEEIWSTGAVVQLDKPLLKATRVRLELGDVEIPGLVMANVYEQIGYYITVQFEAGFRWSPDMYTPEYLFDPATLCEHSWDSRPQPQTKRSRAAQGILK
jgi:hypothetical protein